MIEALLGPELFEIFKQLDKKDQEEFWKEYVIILLEEVQKEIDKEIIESICKNATEHPKNKVEKLPINGEPMDGDQTQRPQDNPDSR